MLRLPHWGGPRRTQRLRPLPRDVSRETGPSSARAGSRGSVVRSGHREAAGAETGSRVRGAAQAEAEVGPGPGQCRSLRYSVLRGTLPARAWCSCAPPRAAQRNSSLGWHARASGRRRPAPPGPVAAGLAAGAHGAPGSSKMRNREELFSCSLHLIHCPYSVFRFS